MISDKWQSFGHFTNKGAIEVTQKGNAVDIDEARGPIRLRLLEQR